MAQRTVCLCDGKYIGIETIYTVKNGRQINIPEKLKILREKSRNNQLFCPCGCGSNLILVAGDQMLKEQHFRLKNGEFNLACKAVTEGEESINSKIVLKCWLDDKLDDAAIESRVPVRAVDDIDSKYEFTFLSREQNIAISYCHERSNLSDEKFDILESNRKNIKIIYVVSRTGIGSGGQYPEHFMKVQGRQGYCLHLFTGDREYYKAKMKAVVYVQDFNGFWQEVTFAEGFLSEYEIDASGNVLYNGILLSVLAEEAENFFSARLEDARIRHEQEIKRREEEKQRLLEEAEQKRREYQKQQEETKKKEEKFRKIRESDFEQQQIPVRDSKGKRWIKCEFCGKIAKESEFDSYGGPGRVNLGTCCECSKNNPEASIVIKTKSPEERKTYDPNRCPVCGKGQLREKIGFYGRFIGCSNFPECRYTRKIKK